MDASCMHAFRRARWMRRVNDDDDDVVVDADARARWWRARASRW